MTPANRTLPRNGSFALHRQKPQATLCQVGLGPDASVARKLVRPRLGGRADADRRHRVACGHRRRRGLAAPHRERDPPCDHADADAHGADGSGDGRRRHLDGVAGRDLRISAAPPSLRRARAAARHTRLSRGLCLRRAPHLHRTRPGADPDAVRLSDEPGLLVSGRALAGRRGAGNELGPLSLYLPCLPLDVSHAGPCGRGCGAHAGRRAAQGLPENPDPDGKAGYRDRPDACRHGDDERHRRGRVSGRPDLDLLHLRHLAQPRQPCRCGADRLHHAGLHRRG
ncbi:hypothetical protein ABIA25_002934 [Sinorhizobium fredii]